MRGRRGFVCMAMLVLVVGVDALGQAGTSQLDAGFGSGGLVVAAAGTGDPASGLRSIVRLPDRRFLAAGTVVVAGHHRLFLGRYLENGSPDTGFGTGGSTLDAIGTGDSTDAAAVALNPAGGSLVAGDALDAGVRKVFLARYDASGAPVGSALLALNAAANVTGMARDPDNGMVYVVGTEGAGAAAKAFVARFTVAGSVDASFQGAGGAVAGSALVDRTGLGQAAHGTAITVSAGKPVLAGFLTDGTSNDDLLLARFTPNGSLDAAFGWSSTSGMTNTSGTVDQQIGNAGPRHAIARAIGRVADPTGGGGGDYYVIAGDVGNNGGQRGVLARYRPDGSPDPGYNTTGYTLLDDSSGGQVFGNALETDSHGYTFAGSAVDGGIRKVYVARRDRDGHPVVGVAENLPTIGSVPPTPYALVAAGADGDAGAAAATLANDGSLLTVAGHADDAGVRKLLLAEFGAHHDPAPVLTVEYDRHGVSDRPARPGQQVTFRAAGSRDVDGRIVDYGWDLDNDGAYETHADTPAAQQRSFSYIAPALDLSGTPQAHAVHLRVTDNEDRAATADATVNVAPNKSPVARLGERTTPGVFAAAQKNVEATIPAGASEDPDGRIVKYEWDLDNDGSFEIDSGAVPFVKHTYTEIGDAPMKLRVTDDEGASATIAQTITVIAQQCGKQTKLGSRLVISGGCVKTRTTSAGQVVYGKDGQAVTFNGVTVDPAKTAHVEILLKKDTTYAIDADKADVSIDTGKICDDREIHYTVDKQGKIKHVVKNSGGRVHGLGFVWGDAPVPSVGANGTSTWTLYPVMPSAFKSVTTDKPLVITTGATKARTAAAGDLSFSMKDLPLGPITFDQVTISYVRATDRWEASGTAALLAIFGAPKLSARFVISHGDLEDAELIVDNLNVPLGPTPFFLKKVGGEIEQKPKESTKCVTHVGKLTIDDFHFPAGTDPAIIDTVEKLLGLPIDYGSPSFAMCGFVGISGGPVILGGALLEIDGTLGYAIYDDRPDVLFAHGDMSVIGIPFAQADLEYHTDGYVAAGAEIHASLLGLLSLDGGIHIEIKAPQFNAIGNLDACIDPIDLCAGVIALVSSKGIAACVDIVGWRAGVGYIWGDAFPDIYFAGCDIDDYKAHIAQNARLEPGSSSAITVRPGLPGIVVRARGDGAPPNFTLTGPQGEVITTPADRRSQMGSNFMMFREPRLDHPPATQVAISHPSAGTWKLTVDPGSTAITDLSTADGLAPPKITAHVTGKGSKRKLAYRSNLGHGENITLAEVGSTDGAARALPAIQKAPVTIAKTKSASGTVAFTPSPRLGTKRTLVATVERNGIPRGEFVIGSYQGPKPRRPRPTKVKVTRQGAAIIVSWRPAKHLRRQLVTVKLSDGRKFIFPVNGGEHRVRIPRGARRGLAVTTAIDSESATSGLRGSFASTAVKLDR